MGLGWNQNLYSFLPKVTKNSSSLSSMPKQQLQQADYQAIINLN